jgi:hypothetical protein
MQDRMICRRYGITGFPSYVVRNGDTEVIIGGYQNLNTFHTLIKRLSAGKIKPRRIGPSIANMLDFVNRYQSVYPVEIETLFSLDRYQTDLIISQEIATGQLLAEPVGKSMRLTTNKIVAEHPKQLSRREKKRHTKE